MHKAQYHGMKRLPLQVVRIFTRAVNLIPQKRVPDAGHMHADLMGPPCFQPAFNVGCVPETLQNLIMGYSFLPVLIVNGHLFTVNRMAADRPFHRPLVILQIP